MQEQPSGEGGDDGFQAHDQGGHRGIQILLSDDLEGIAQAAGEGTGVYDGHPGRKDAAEIRALEQKHTDGAQDGVGQGLDAGELHAVHQGREMVHRQNLDGEDDRTGEEIDIACLQTEVPLRHAEQIHAQSGQRHGSPDAQADFLAQENPEQGHDHHVQRADEARLAHGGLPHAELLQGASAEQADAAADAPDKQESMILPPVCGLLRPFDAPV